MKSTSMFLLLLLANTAIASELEDSMLAALRSCALPKLEGKPISQDLPSNLFVEIPAPSVEDARRKIVHSYKSVTPQFDYKLDIYEKQGCLFTYSIKATDDVMRESDRPFTALLKKYKVYEMGSPVDANPGFNAYQVKSEYADFDVSTRFETKGDRTFVSILIPTK